MSRRDVRVALAMRDRLIHGYDAVDFDILWRAVGEDLPALVAALDGMIAVVQEDGG